MNTTNVKNCKTLDRRNFIANTGLALGAYPLLFTAGLLGGCAGATQGEKAGALGIASPDRAPKPDFHLKIRMENIEIAKGHMVETLAMNGTIPGPLIRLNEGKRATLQVSNATRREELVHWHGLFLPSDVDGAKQQGSPMIPPGKSLCYTFIPKPAGTRWYHSHSGSDGDFRQGTYSGMNGIIYIEPKKEPGRYDREVFLAIHAWGAEIIGSEIKHSAITFNGRMLGHGAPVQVKHGERVIFRILNSGPTAGTRLSLSGHRCQVIAMDGNSVPNPVMVDFFNVAPGERIDVLVEMNNPGIWIFGDGSQSSRDAGAGIVVEYAHAKGKAQWRAPALGRWNLCSFTKGTKRYNPDHVYNMYFDEIATPEGQLSRWSINGKSFPDMDNFMLEEGKRYRLNLHNRTNGIHPMHIHRHIFEITHYMGEYTSGLFKDVVSVVSNQSVSLDFVADAPGLTLFHCHMTSHMENGFMALFEYKA